MSFPHTSVQCLCAIARHHGLTVNPKAIVHEHALKDDEPAIPKLIAMANEMGLQAQQRTIDWEDLIEQQGVFPIMARLVNRNAVVVVGVREPAVGPDGVRGETKIAILDPLESQSDILLLTKAQFCSQWRGEAVFAKRNYALRDEKQPFGFRWFVPEIIRQGKAFRDIALAAIILHFLMMASPIFFQLVIDRVLVHQSISTLWTLAVGVLIALIFDGVFSFLRQYITLAATNKIDIRITRRAFSHLMSLPIHYFESTTAGVIVRHMQQLERIRGFLTGRLFFTALDATALIFFIPILFTYSGKLATITLGFALMIAIVMAMMLPAFQRRLNQLYTAEGRRQSSLVEVVHGMRTIKALALEPAKRRDWDQQSAEAIQAAYRVGKISLIGTAATDFLGKLLPVTIIVIGAQDVFTQSVSVGTLIAFQMISGRVVTPLIQIVGLINEYQETAISVRMLGEVMNRSPEGRSGGGGLRPQLQGEIRFEDVSFRYPGASHMALNRANFTIKAGSVVGIVGRSGSGKTTITKLIQGLYPIQEGIVRFDNYDARDIDLGHLRKHIGVVLQENFLFRGTIRDNIRATKPDATFEEIAAVAQAAGADEFIERLPQGYDTFIEEGATNLSGGQKQRLSIARSLLANPPILILDEAASALDPESEAIFINNLSKIAVGRTVVMISHRLSTLVNADAILVMHQGSLQDCGRHEELVERCEAYQVLWNQQTSHIH